VSQESVRAREYREAHARAVDSRDTAQLALEATIEHGVEPGHAAEAWHKVRALQAQAQLDILHVISHDLSAISDSMTE
jgi:hypothetical protein